MKTLIILIASVLILATPVTSHGLALDKQKILNDLQTLYPYFKPDEIQRKIQTVTDGEHFLRTFIPYYYFTLKNNPQMTGNLISMAREAGWCVGDAHYSNFGAILNRGGVADFTINDLDDAGPCPLFTDVLKLFVSARLVTPQFNFQQLLKAYILGLSGAPSNLSPEVRQLLLNSQKIGAVPDPKELASPTKLLRDVNGREFTAEEKTAVIAALNHAYANSAIMIDGYASFKTGGGSHGLQIFKVLLKSRPSSRTPFSDTQLVQFKRLVSPGIFPLLVGPMPNVMDRIHTTLMVEQGQTFSGFYGVETVLKTPYLLTPEWMGNLKIDPRTLNPAQLFNVALDEFYVLGRIHSHSASPAYPQMIAQTAVTDWQLAAQTIGAYMIEVFKTVK